jgi:hypothetical protein
MVEPPAPPPPPEGPPPPSTPGGTPPDWDDMRRKVATARGPELILLIAGAAFLIATFLPWYRASVGRLTVSDHAWGSGGLGVLAAILGVGAMVVALMSVTGTKSLGSQSAGLLAFVLSVLALVFTFLRLVIRPEGASEIERLSGGLVDVSRGIGLWIGFAAAIVMTVAAYQKYRASAV